MRKEQFIQKGELIYQRLKSKLEKSYKGDVVAIEPETSKFIIGKDILDAAVKASKEYPNKIFYFMRIGYPAVHKLRKNK